MRSDAQLSEDWAGIMQAVDRAALAVIEKRFNYAEGQIREVLARFEQELLIVRGFEVREALAGRAKASGSGSVRNLPTEGEGGGDAHEVVNPPAARAIFAPVVDD